MRIEGEIEKQLKYDLHQRISRFYQNLLEELMTKERFRTLQVREDDIPQIRMTLENAKKCTKALLDMDDIPEEAFVDVLQDVDIAGTHDELVDFIEEYFPETE